MTPEVIPFVRESEAECAPIQGHDSVYDRIRPEMLAAHALPNHLRQLQPRNHGIARWLALAVLTGALAALAFVSLLAR
jgi:hypothetical protein